jgi:capsular polysaccharide transport system permease protein
MELIMAILTNWCAPKLFIELAHGIQVQRRVIVAIILREVRTRFGQYHLGYLWAVLVPLMFIGVLTMVHIALGRRAAYGVSIEMLMLTGMLVWLTFVETQTQTANAYRANRQLVVYPMVTVVDIVIARVILEFASKLRVMVVLMVIFWTAGYNVSMDDPLGVVLNLATICYMAACYGHIIGCIIVVMPSIQFIINSSRRVLFYTSGAIFLLSDVPDAWLPYILLNPIAHVIDFGRGAWLAAYHAPYGDMMYIVQWIIALTALAAIAEKIARRRRLGSNT